VFTTSVLNDHPTPTSELMTLSCGVLFFLAFFVAMYVEVKAKYTIYQVNISLTIQQSISIKKKTNYKP
jgi:hypothetical protein